MQPRLETTGEMGSFFPNSGPSVAVPMTAIGEKPALEIEMKGVFYLLVVSKLQSAKTTW